jgi:beta-1,4-mannooligosaccharide/beta-1,4-mannosyl-N-acetylglucosamine phosphorylase
MATSAPVQSASNHVVTPASIPWQDRPSGSSELIWRYSQNPVIDRNPIPVAARIYNSAVVPFKGHFAGVFRSDYRTGMPHIHAGFSEDGLKWKINHEPIAFVPAGQTKYEMEYSYDPRVCWIEDRYYVTWCNGYHGAPTIGLASTTDFKTFAQYENLFIPFNRNGVLFPRRINGHYAILSRPSDSGHTPFGDIYYSESPDLRFWGNHRYVMGAGQNWWQGVKIGAGPTPIETSEGWLIFYHGVMSTCNGFVYSVGLALLDLDEPWRVIARAQSYVLGPEKIYETTGTVPNVVFPCAALHDKASGRIALYYGAADTVTGLAFCKIDEVLEFVKKDSAA